MKVIFIEDVPNVARAGQTKDVANGYARNFLFPRKLAVLANSREAAAIDAHLKKIVKLKAIEEAQMAELAKAVNGTELVFQAKVGESDKLYGSVTAAEIAEMLGKQIGREVDKKKVDLAEPIRQVGVYDITLRFTHEITAVVTTVVMSDAPDAVKPERVVEKAEEKKEEKKEKAPKKEKKEKAPKEAKEEATAAVEETAVEETAAEEKPEKPAKEKKAKAEKASKEEKPAKEEKAKEDKPAKEEKAEKEEKKEKKPRSRAKKSGDDVEEKKE